MEAETTQGHWSAEVGGRPSINQAGSMVYLPSGSRVKLSLLDGAAKVTIAGAAGKPGVKPSVIRPEEAIHATARDREVDPGYGFYAREPLDEAARLDDRATGLDGRVTCLDDRPAPLHRATHIFLRLPRIKRQPF